MNIDDKPDFIRYDNLEILKKMKLLRTMIKIRAAEIKIASLVEKKNICTPCHLYIGQEAIAVGVCAVLKKNDYLFSNHRAHGHYLAKGGDIKTFFAEIFCKAKGCSGGRGGSMHLCSPEVGIFGTSSIVGGVMGIGLGSALASKIRKSKRITVVFHGDSVPEEGIWHESLNFAAVNRLPIVYVCENNLYSAHMPLLRRRVADNIVEVAKAHRLETYETDGNNVLDVYKNAKTAVERARVGYGPQFIECRTYRWMGHVGPNDDIDKGLRSKEELNFWKSRCPIACFSEYLINKCGVVQEKIVSILKEVEETVNKAVKYAENSKYPNVNTLKDNIYSNRGD